MRKPEPAATITVPLAEAREIAADLYTAHRMLKAEPAEVGSPKLEAALERLRQVARLFLDASHQPGLPGTEETALGKL